MNDKHPFDPTPEEQQYFERSGCATIAWMVVGIFFFGILAATLYLFAR